MRANGTYVRLSLVPQLLYAVKATGQRALVSEGVVFALAIGVGDKEACHQMRLTAAGRRGGRALKLF